MKFLILCLSIVIVCGIQAVMTLNEPSKFSKVECYTPLPFAKNAVYYYLYRNPEGFINFSECVKITPLYYEKVSLKNGEVGFIQKIESDKICVMKNFSFYPISLCKTELEYIRLKHTFE